MHRYASDVIEYVYSTTTENEKYRKEMVQAFYGQYFILFKAQEAENAISGKDQDTQ